MQSLEDILKELDAEEMSGEGEEGDEELEAERRMEALLAGEIVSHDVLVARLSISPPPLPSHPSPFYCSRSFSIGPATAFTLHPLAPCDAIGVRTPSFPFPYFFRHIAPPCTKKSKTTKIPPTIRSTFEEIYHHRYTHTRVGKKRDRPTLNAFPVAAGVVMAGMNSSVGEVIICSACSRESWVVFSGQH